MTTKFTAQEMLGYRDSVVQCLQQELALLSEMHEYGMFNKDEGIITRENYPHKVEIIKGEITKLENFDVVLSVVGTMKAGKSTTINAIVGREILPNRNRPMTALPTLIYHTPEQTEPVLSFHNQAVNEFVGKLKTHLQNHAHLRELPELQTDEMKALIANIQAGWTFQPEYHGEEAIFEFLFGLNDLVRLAGYINEKDKSIEFPFAECRNIEQLPQIKVAFRHLTHMPANQGRLVLLDTPGPNEAGQKRLRGMLTEQLQRSSAVMLVLDYTQLKSEASNDVKKQLEEVPTISKERLFALVNKFDQKNANSDDEEQTKNLISQEFLPEKIEREHIYPLAAQTAFLANRMAAELASKGKPEWMEGGWFNDFIKLAYGTRMKANKWEHEEIEDIQEAIDELIEESRVQIPLQEAIIQTQMEAPKIALQAAMLTLDETMKECQDFTTIYETIADNENKIAELKETSQKLRIQVEKLHRLKEKAERELPSTLSKIHQNLSEEITAISTTISSVVEDKINIQRDELEQKIDYLSLKDKWFFFTNQEEREKRRQLLAEFTSQLNALDENLSSFSDKEKAEGYLNNLKKDMNRHTHEIIYGVQKTVENAQSQFKNEIQTIQTDCRDLFEQIYVALKKEGFEFSQPSFQHKALKAYELKFPELSEHIQEVHKTTLKKANFIGAGIMRWLGDKVGTDWGYDKISVIQFEISATQVNQNFIEPIKQYLEEVQNDIEEMFNEFEEEWIIEFAGNIYNTAENLLDEIDTALQTNIVDQELAEKYRKQMKCFAKRNGDIREDYEKFAKVINAM